MTFGRSDDFGEIAFCLIIPSPVPTSDFARSFRSAVLAGEGRFFGWHVIVPSQVLRFGRSVHKSGSVRSKHHSTASTSDLVAIA